MYNEPSAVHGGGLNDSVWNDLKATNQLIFFFSCTDSPREMNQTEVLFHKKLVYYI